MHKGEGTYFVASGGLQLKQALAQTGPEHMVQRIEEQLQQGPSGGFLEGLGAGRCCFFSADCLWKELVELLFERTFFIYVL
jgi:hypothetical protein